VQFCRVLLSGQATGDGLLVHQVPF